MAKYRQLHTDFWNDGFVMDLTPEEKYFYLYLMTNPHAAQCGIYELPKRIIETQTGYNRETVDKLLSRFAEYKKIHYCDETKEIIIINWIKFNQPSSPNAIKCVNRELKSVKNKKFISILYDLCNNLNLDLDKLFHGMEDLVINLSKVKSEKVEKELDLKETGKENEDYNIEKDLKSSEQNINDVIDIFKDNIHTLTPMEYKKIIKWGKDYNCNVIVLAIEEAVNRNVKNIRYIEKILENWKAQGVNTPEEVRAYRQEWENRKRNKTDSFNYDGQRQYDYDDLEKKLLGWDKEEEKKG